LTNLGQRLYLGPNIYSINMSASPSTSGSFKGIKSCARTHFEDFHAFLNIHIVNNPVRWLNLSPDGVIYEIRDNWWGGEMYEMSQQPDDSLDKDEEA